MNKDRYFDLMRETSEVVYPLIEAQLANIKNEDAALHSIVRYVADKRDWNLLLRPFIIRLTYELCGGTEWQKTAAVGAAFELLNISSYQSNSAFDNKNMVLTPQQKNAQFIASMVTREIANEILATVRADFPDNVVGVLMQDISSCNKNMYIAQHYDMDLLTIANRYRYNDEATFLTAYTRRCYLGCGIFTGLCARAGGLLANAGPDALAALNKFGDEFGTALQIVNDLGDFVAPGIDPAIANCSKDQFSDLRNGRMTLGCYKLFKDCGDAGKTIFDRLIDGETIDEKEFESISKLMVSEGAIDTIIEKSIFHEHLAGQALMHFSDSYARECLFQMLTVCHQNKFIKALL